MKVETLIRIEGDYDPELQHAPDFIYVRRIETLAFAPGADEDAEQAVGELSQAIQSVIDEAYDRAMKQVALAADHIRANLG